MRKPGSTEVEFEPYTEAFAADPYSVYAELREHSPVFWSAEFGMTFLTRYRDIFSALTDRRLGRAPAVEAAREPLISQGTFADRRGDALPVKASATEGAIPGTGALPNYDRYVHVNLLETEGETHARLRKLLSQALSPRRIAELHGRVQEIAAGLMEPLAAGTEMDFIAEVAEPLPVIVISELLGWPQAERDRLRPWSAAIVRLYEKDASPEDAKRAEAACAEFAAILDALASKRKASPADDFISAAVALEDEPRGLSRDELISSCMLLLNAGHEATVNAAGNGLLALLRHPAAMEKLRREPSLVASAVEEMLRYDPPLHLFHRFAYEKLNIAGHVVPRGGKVGLLYGSANRDPDMFADPDTFDMERSPNRHLSFGAATHFCLGAPLARLELRILFTTLLANSRQIELLDPTPQHHPGLVFRSLKHLRLRT